MIIGLQISSTYEYPIVSVFSMDIAMYISIYECIFTLLCKSLHSNVVVKNMQLQCSQNLCIICVNEIERYITSVM